MGFDRSAIEGSPDFIPQENDSQNESQNDQLYVYGFDLIWYVKRGLCPAGKKFMDQKRKAGKNFAHIFHHTILFF